MLYEALIAELIAVMQRGARVCAGTTIVKKASEYRQHADECRVMASKTGAGPQKDQLLEMAATWEKLAAERSALVHRHPELAIEDEHREELARHEV